MKSDIFKSNIVSIVTDYNNLKDIDYQELNEIMGGIEEIMNEAINLLADNLHLKINEIKDAFVKNDIELVKKLSHKLKGAALNAAAKKLAKILSDIEKFQLNNNIEELKNLIDELEKAQISFEKNIKLNIKNN